MKIGILGGTFNPIHFGHLRIAESAYESFDLDEVWFMPNGTPPHKDEKVTANDLKHRISMLELAIKGTPHFRISLKEAKLHEASYTYSTMKSFKKEFPDVEFYFILGADSLFAIEKWKRFEEIFPSCTILAAMREDREVGESEHLSHRAAYLAKRYGAKIELLKAPIIDISSSDIRECVKKGLGISTMTTKSVADYIEKNRLYYSPPKYPLGKFNKRLKKKITSKRYTHTQGVMYTAATIAMKYKVDIHDAMTAGLLHDCGKYPSIKKQLIEAEKYGVTLTEREIQTPSLIHATLGATLAKEVYGVTDQAILDAIFYHTTGRPNMSPLEKIIYLADFIEPNRGDTWWARMIRDLVFVDMDEAVYKCAQLTVSFLEEKGRKVDEATLKTLEYYGGKKSDTC